MTSFFPEVTAGQIVVTRVGQIVTLELVDMSLAANTSGAFYYMSGRIPVEFRPRRFQYAKTAAPNLGETTKELRVTDTGQITVYRPADIHRITMSWPTLNTWPTS